jgi:hypothetical protein
MTLGLSLVKWLWFRQSCAPLQFNYTLCVSTVIQLNRYMYNKICPFGM